MTDNNPSTPLLVVLFPQFSNPWCETIVPQIQKSDVHPFSVGAT